mgnify:CR=1 FL=1
MEKQYDYLVIGGGYNNNCSILEEYQTPSGYQGKSLNIYNQQTKQWHQTWVDNTGLLLQLNGEFKQGVMTLSGLTVDNKGQEVLNKISWKKLSDGRVNQVWQTSTDKGKKRVEKTHLKIALKTPRMTGAQSEL